MKKRILFIVILLAGACFFLSAQLPQDVYKKQLKDVLMDIEKRYDIKLTYSQGLVKDVDVLYPTWRYRSDAETTLTNILYPLDFIFQKTGEKTFQVSKYAYHQRPLEEGRKHLEKLLSSYPDAEAWEARKAELRKCFLESIGLTKLPVRAPLNPIYTAVRKFDGYTVQNVGIETYPGLYLCGSLYRPAKGKGLFPAVLSPHGHFTSQDMNQVGRYRPDQQYRCATLARMGAVVFSYEMFAYGESLLQVSAADHRTSLAMTVQTLNSIRVLDFLTSLGYVDDTRIGVTGESGGGTQTFLLTALDDRISVSVPVVMVSSFFYGGCACESGLPVHSCTDIFTNNAEIAAMASPRPMLVISDGNDWTREVPVLEYPYLRKVYSLYGKESNIENVHLANEGHDYGLSKRIAMYGFMARHLGLDLGAVKDKSGKIDESKVTIEGYEAQLVFGKDGVLPANALKGADKIREVISTLR
ncbi:MAG: acetylxylan esterase [Bacteroidales bacterium]|nr:acetylxylan esterase [Bacteroidales bacterium]